MSRGKRRICSRVRRAAPDSNQRGVPPEARGETRTAMGQRIAIYQIAKDQSGTEGRPLINAVSGLMFRTDEKIAEGRIPPSIAG